MATLFFDTSSDVLVGGVLVDDALVAAFDTERRAQAVIDLVDRMLRDAGVAREQLDAIAVGTGPGGFTGLRIGVATARGLAAALGVPLAGLSTLAAVALQATDTDAGGIVWASLDARRGERFVQRFRLGSGGGVRATGDLLVVPESDVAALVVDGTLAEGPPNAQGLAVLARGAVYDDPMAVLPVYGRVPDAKPSPGAAGARA